jgi:hypothetical protein
MKGLYVFLLTLVVWLSGCVSIDYTNGQETLEVNTLFKSLDGLWSSRDENGFSLIIDKTYTHDPLRGISELLETYQKLYGMGLRYDPGWRSPDGPPQLE